MSDELQAATFDLGDGEAAVTGTQGRECDRCGRDRPANDERLRMTVSDVTDGSISQEQALLCAGCWFTAREEFRRWLA